MTYSPEILIILAIAAGGLLIAGIIIGLLSIRSGKVRRIAVEEDRQRQDDRRLVEAEDKARDRAEEKARADKIEQTLAQLAGAQNQLSGRLQQLGEAQATSQTKTMKTLEERLDAITGKVHVSLSESAEKTAKSMGELNTRLTVIDEAQKNITELSGQVVDLQQILDNKQSRGRFGEIRMQDIFTDALPPNAYEFQSTLSNGKIPDALILMPNPPGPICVDSKFPLQPWKEMKDAENSETPIAAQRSFRQAMKKHISDIAAKYILPGETAESAIMFLPSEAIYAEIHGNYPDIIEESFRSRVWIVSPSTLMATLNTVRAILKDVAMREQAHLIQTEVGKMMIEVKRLDDRVGNLSKHFTMVNKDVDLISISSGKILKKGAGIEDLQLEEPQIDALPSDDPHSDS